MQGLREAPVYSSEALGRWLVLWKALLVCSLLVFYLEGTVGVNLQGFFYLEIVFLLLLLVEYVVFKQPKTLHRSTMVPQTFWTFWQDVLRLVARGEERRRYARTRWNDYSSRGCSQRCLACLLVFCCFFFKCFFFLLGSLHLTGVVLS